MDMNLLKDKMNRVLDNLAKEFATIRTGRANAAVLDRISVEYYGFMTPLKEISQITTPEARVIMIKPYEQEALKMIEKAIRDSNIGLNPNNDGTVIRLNVPALTEERRKEIVKSLGKTCEEARVAIRNARRDANETLKRDKSLPEDQRKRDEKEVQKITDEFIKKIDSIAEAKQKEIMTV